MPPDWPDVSMARMRIVFLKSPSCGRGRIPIARINYVGPPEWMVRSECLNRNISPWQERSGRPTGAALAYLEWSIRELIRRRRTRGRRPIQAAPARILQARRSGQCWRGNARQQIFRPAPFPQGAQPSAKNRPSLRELSDQEPKIHEADRCCLAFFWLTAQPEFVDLLIRQHGDENINSFPRERAQFIAKPITTTRSGDNRDAVRSGILDGVDGCFHLSSYRCPIYPTTPNRWTTST